ncbi:uncharacterized protein LOC106180817 [Lingula anatina]|uniref:Uncharacterized protein LOC106180817 n=1 Tax=Lingula anatina TaxID=7574 RepID=A0A1S3KD70_LINAN|nr:uncharacterized protein LOC106180817 [Lingula anatina]|eukprot:XP_013420404.1 uncharacterized protein LOC106180817 [Lingula anatina]
MKDIDLHDNIQVAVPRTKRSKRQLKPVAVPSLFSWQKEESQAAKNRSNRARRRSDRGEQPQPNPEVVFEGVDVTEEIIEVDTPDIVLEATSAPTTLGDSSTQTPFYPKLSIEELSTNDKMLNYYTGLQNHEHFVYVLSTLGPAAYHLNYRWRKPINISVENQLLLTLVKLRLHSPNKEVGFLFGISEFCVSNIFVTWVNFMYFEWQKLDIWPVKELVDFYMPQDFKDKFPTTRVIIDGVEMPIKKPSKPVAQQVTFSTYKNKNTIKTIVGVTPGGMVSHIPPAYGGSASDRLLIERDNIHVKCQRGDSVMADKGFDIQDIYAPYGVLVNTPTFFRNKNQLSGTEILHDRKIASKRVHVERLIGLAKTYNIMKTPLNDTETALGTQIVFVCFMLVNFRNCIVPKTA